MPAIGDKTATSGFTLADLRTWKMLSAVLALLLHSPWARGGELQRFVFERAEMGLPFRVTLYAPAQEQAAAAAEAAFNHIATLNAIFSDYDSDSELSRLSATAGQGKAVRVSSKLWQVLEQSQGYARRSDGAFDVTVGPLVSAWRRARQKREIPPADLLAGLRSAVGFEKMRMDPDTQTVELLKEGMRLDLGAIAKGFAIDEALDILKKRGFPRALVAGSGDMAAGDPPPGERGWKIQVAALDFPGAPLAQTVLLANSGIATSGDVFQRLEIDGVRYSHIVHPHTGLGLTDHSLVTVVAPDCTTADALATTVSVLGADRGFTLIEETSGAAAYVVRKPGDRIESRASARWGAVPKAL